MFQCLGDGDGGRQIEVVNRSFTPGRYTSAVAAFRHGMRPGDDMVTIDDNSLIDWGVFTRARSELGAGFVRILGYFREDGVKSVAAIEAAMRARNAAAMVIPAHTLKGEARQFGAEPLGAIAERIETIARDCVENHDTPDEALAEIVTLRPTFEKTLTMLEREANPLVERRPMGFGRRTG